MSQGTCQQQQGWLCTVFGLETSYDTTIACCNRLIQMLNSNMQLINSEGVSLGDVVYAACACRKQGDVQEATNRASLGGVEWGAREAASIGRWAHRRA